MTSLRSCSMHVVALLVAVQLLFCSGGRVNLGNNFLVRWDDSADDLRSSHALKITRIDSSNQVSPAVVWGTYNKHPFLRLGNASMPRPPILDGNYQLEEEVEFVSDVNTIDAAAVNADDHSLEFTGRLLSVRDDSNHAELVARYLLKFTLQSDNVQFTVDVTPLKERFLTNDGKNSLTNPRTFLTYACEKDENFYGFGESFSFFNLKGRNVPILVSEQGVGRGEQPITDTLNSDVAQGVGGAWYTTYAPKPIYITNHNRTVMLNNSEVSFFNLTASSGDADGTAPRVQIEVWSLHLLGYLMQSPSMLRAVEAVTALTGRQSVLPEWTQLGAVVGLEGGTANVTAIVDRMYAAGVPMAGIWLQDWVGLQHSWDGDRLIWNWELNSDHYPGWADMTAKWASRGTRVLTYMSPFFSDPSAYSNSTTAFRHNFFQEGVAKGYFVQNGNGSTYLMYSLSIKFAMLDLTNPAAVAWMKEIIIQQSVQEAGSSGWMCDFGEYLPFDAVLHSGEPAASFHNRFPEEWGALTKSALTEAAQRHRTAQVERLATGTAGDATSAAAQTPVRATAGVGAAIDPADVMFFMRSAWIQSPRYAPVFWLGDQLVSWDSNDGLRSALTGALSSGLVGHAITHSDIGGYTVETDLGADMYYVRTPELLQRWSEMGAFGFGLFRTHIGSSTTPLDAQVYDSPESMAHFARFASIYAQQWGYRRELMQEAAETGHPLIRPLCMHYGYDAAVWELTEQYLVGTQLLVAPALYEGATSVDVYFPRLSGSWVHIWSGNVVTPADPDQGLTVTVPAGMGFPPAFYQQGSARGEELRAYLLQQGYTDGYHWDYPAAPGGASEVAAQEGEEVTQVGSAEGGSGAALDYVLPLLVVLLLLLAVTSVHAVRTLRSRAAESKHPLQDAQQRLLPAEQDDTL